MNHSSIFKLAKINTKTCFLLFFILMSFKILAAEGGPCKDYGECDNFKPMLNDSSSLQRGASLYLNYCYGCHSLQYSRWGRVSKDLKIPEDIFFNNLVFDKSIKPGDLMKGSMNKDESANWFGVAPPDLTLVTRSKGADWVYSYLRAYYSDNNKQYGVNNLVYPGTAMPNVLLSFQGVQNLVCKDKPLIADNGGEKRDSKGDTIFEKSCGHLELQEGSGLLNKAEFDSLIYDLTNFLVYVGEPAKVERERIGWYVVFFLIIFTLLSSLLYREYQKDYH